MAKKIQLSEVDEILGGGPEVNEHVILCVYQGHEGIIDNEGNIIVPFKYSAINGYVWDSSGRLAVINDEGLLGHVDIHGNEVIPCQFPFQLFGEDGYYCFNQDRYAIEDENGLIGFIDPNGKIVIPGQFYNVRHFNEGLCAVENHKGLWGYIDLQGNLVIPYQFHTAYNFCSKGTATVVATVTKWGLFQKKEMVTIDRKGNIITKVL